ncbi:hypothetical protein BC629DRAFT_1574549 [Irpex lacteus]|nr:hypothetical protein BC629DRAFT_1574549 [Irpex lacteus]
MTSTHVSKRTGENREVPSHGQQHEWTKERRERLHPPPDGARRPTRLSHGRSPD